VKGLVKAARDGGFDHLAQRLRDERGEASEVAKVNDALTEAGVRVIDRPSWSDPGVEDDPRSR
jgi:ParB family transcriptional regulator, chromosome partitioning protein